MAVSATALAAYCDDLVDEIIESDPDISEEQARAAVDRWAKEAEEGTVQVSDDPEGEAEFIVNESRYWN